jgi:hypothetical protein
VKGEDDGDSSKHFIYMHEDRMMKAMKNHL